MKKDRNYIVSEQNQYFFVKIVEFQKVKIRRQSKKLQIQDAQIPRNEEYLLYAAMTCPVKSALPSRVARI